MSDNWLFSDPPDVAVFTTTRVIREGQPILLVIHDEEDGAWQFLDGGPASYKVAMLVSLYLIVQRDPTITELADLPGGWRAWRRAPGEPWQREKFEEEA